RPAQGRQEARRTLPLDAAGPPQLAVARLRLQHDGHALETGQDVEADAYAPVLLEAVAAARGVGRARRQAELARAGIAPVLQEEGLDPRRDRAGLHDGVADPHAPVAVAVVLDRRLYHDGAEENHHHSADHGRQAAGAAPAREGRIAQ